MHEFLLNKIGVRERGKVTEGRRQHGENSRSLASQVLDQDAMVETLQPQKRHGFRMTRECERDYENVPAVRD